jgi:hypothetical protein
MMTRRTLLRIVLTASCALAPLTAQAAYTPPQDALFDENLADGFLVPLNKRQAAAAAERQAKQSAERRAREQRATFGGGIAAADDEGDGETHASAWEEEAEDDAGATADEALVGVLESIEQTLTGIREDSQTIENRRRQRMMDRLDEQQYRQQTYGAAYADIQYGPGTLHSGAPLAHTGPESWLAGGTMFGAIAYTLWKSRRGAVR